MGLFGLFDLFRREPDPAAQVGTEVVQWVYPGGRQEMESKGKVAAHLSDGKLNVKDAAFVCFWVKFQFKVAHTNFDGLNHFGPKLEALLNAVKTASKGKLNTTETVSILYYAIFDKVDTTAETESTIQAYLTGLYGSDQIGCATDEIPGGAGEFGFEPTNPIPVRGIASSEIYLDRLRTADGREVLHSRTRSLVVPGVRERVDQYEITQDGKTLCALFIHPYNRRISQRPPDGFVFISSNASDASSESPQLGTNPISYVRVVAVIRYAAIVAAKRLADLGKINKMQFLGSVKEFLAFYSTVACNEICIRLNATGPEAVANTYKAIAEAFRDMQHNLELEPLRIPEEVKLQISEIVNAPNSDFNSLFRAYWNGDLDALYISDSDIEELFTKGVKRPSHGLTGAAAYGLLVRACRLENPSNELPPTVVFIVYEKIIKEEFENFMSVLKRVLS